MSFPQFGEIIEEAKEFPEYGEIIPEVSRARSIAGAFPKGAIKGINELLSFLSPASQGPIPREYGEKILEHLLPTQDKLPEKLLERTGRIVPTAALGGEAFIPTAIRTGAAALGGQALEEAGAPSWLQNLTELLAFTSPRFGKTLQPAKSQKEAVEFLRGKGLTDKEITPLIQSEKKLRQLAPLAMKGERSKKAIVGAHEKLGKAIGEVKEKGRTLFPKAQDASKFMNELHDKISTINPRFSRLIEKDVEALSNRPLSFENLVNFQQDINAIVKGQEGGKAVLNILKEPIAKALHNADPELAKQYRMLNEFYAKKSRVAKSLTNKELQDLLDSGEKIALAAAIANGSMGFIGKVVGGITARGIMQEMLINPRLQNISNQMLKAVDNNKLAVAEKLLRTFGKELEKTTPDLAREVLRLEDTNSQ